MAQVQRDERAARPAEGLDAGVAEEAALRVEPREARVFPQGRRERRGAARADVVPGDAQGRERRQRLRQHVREREATPEADAATLGEAAAARQVEVRQARDALGPRARRVREAHGDAVAHAALAEVEPRQRSARGAEEHRVRRPRLDGLPVQPHRRVLVVARGLGLVRRERARRARRDLARTTMAVGPARRRVEVAATKRDALQLRLAAFRRLLLRAGQRRLPR